MKKFSKKLSTIMVCLSLCFSSIVHSAQNYRTILDDKKQSQNLYDKYKKLSKKDKLLYILPTPFIIFFLSLFVKNYLKEYFMIKKHKNVLSSLYDCFNTDDALLTIDKKQVNFKCLLLNNENDISILKDRIISIFDSYQGQEIKLKLFGNILIIKDLLKQFQNGIDKEIKYMYDGEGFYYVNIYKKDIASEFLSYDMSIADDCMFFIYFVNYSTEINLESYLNYFIKECSLKYYKILIVKSNM